MAESKFLATVFDYETELFSGEVTAVSSQNSVGPFDVLGLHSNFITQIEGQLTLHLSGDQQKQWSIQSGVLRCLETAVNVYIVPQGSEKQK